MLHTKYHEVEKLNTALNIKWWRTHKRYAHFSRDLWSSWCVTWDHAESRRRRENERPWERGCSWARDCRQRAYRAILMTYPRDNKLARSLPDCSWILIFTDWAIRIEKSSWLCLLRGFAKPRIAYSGYNDKNSSCFYMFSCNWLDCLWRGCILMRAGECFIYHCMVEVWFFFQLCRLVSEGMR